MAEDYVRPPIVALPAPDHRMAMWRFRIAMGALLLLLIVIIVLAARAIVHQNDGSGTVGMRPGHVAAQFATDER